MTAFLEKISQNPATPETFSLKTDEIDLEIRYNPNQHYARGSRLDYKVVYRLTENVVYNALAEKASQVAGVDFNGLRGIFICDGGCRFLDGHTLNSQQSYTLKDVITQFLRDHPEIGFVVTVVVKRERPYWSISPHDENPYRVFLDLFPSPTCPHSSFDLFNLVESLTFPHPKLNAVNAMNHLKWAKEQNTPYQGLYHSGSWTVAQDRTIIRCSSRRLLELLAGRITQQEFLRDQGFLTDNPFHQALNTGRLAISLQRSDEDDDDWIVFEMNGLDAAIARFLSKVER